VKDDKFEGIIAAFILSNAFVLCFEVQYKGLQVGFELQYSGCKEEAHVVWPAADIVFILFDWFFGLVFVCEASVKILVYASRYFCDGWNWLDLTCVLAFVVDKIATALLPINSQALRLLRLLRPARLVRPLRTMESLDSLYVMTTAIKGMSKVVMWAVALLSVMLMTVALFLTQALHTSYFRDVAAGDEKQQKLFEYFGTLTRCLLSMFELTLANWPPVARLLSEEVSEWFVVFCVIHKLTIGFAVIQVITGVILQETFKVAQTDDMIMVRQKKRAFDTMNKKMQTLFEALDHNSDGALDYEEFEIIAHIPEVKMWLASMDVETDDLDTLFRLVDDDHSGTITAEELVSRMPRIKGTARSIDVMALRYELQSAQPSLLAVKPPMSINRQPSPSGSEPRAAPINIAALM